MFPTKEERKRARRKVQKFAAYIQTYRLILTLECGHRTTVTVSGARYEAGYRGPKITECSECADLLSQERIKADRATQCERDAEMARETGDISGQPCP